MRDAGSAGRRAASGELRPEHGISASDGSVGGSLGYWRRTAAVGFYVHGAPGRLARKRFPAVVRGALVIVCLTVSAFALAQEARSVSSPEVHQSIEATTHLLAGLSGRVPDGVAAFSKASFAEHDKTMERAWKQFRAQRLDALTAFSARELAGYRASQDLVFYPFSGPDVVHALALFPQSRQIVLTGLEPVGEVPNLVALDDHEIALVLADLRRSLHSLLGAGFSKTNDMREAMRTERNVGVLPVLLVLLARYEAKIGKIQTVQLTADARLAPHGRHAARDATENLVEGVSITFRMPGDTEDRVLYYFAADISDSGLKRTPQYLQWVRNAGTQTTFLKAASYLMHKPYFSKIRSFLLEHSRLLVQDDSGVPYRFFSDDRWERQLYGKYLGPIPLFSDWYQSDMQHAYEKKSRPLEFGFGYRSARGTSNLQVMARR